MAKVTFDGDNRIIQVNSGVTQLDLKTDVYSEWKRWMLENYNSKFLQAFRVVGGDPIDEENGIYIAMYLFLQNGWRIRPQEANHTLNVYSGILLVDGGGDPFLDTTGGYTVRINYHQPLQAITVATGSVSPDIIAEKVWSVDTTELNVPGTVGKIVVDTRKITEDNQALIISS